jgi:hypothetical protein
MDYCIAIVAKRWKQFAIFSENHPIFMSFACSFIPLISLPIYQSNSIFGLKKDDVEIAILMSAVNVFIAKTVKVIYSWPIILAETKVKYIQAKKFVFSLKNQISESAITPLVVIAFSIGVIIKCKSLPTYKKLHKLSAFESNLLKMGLVRFL